MTITLVPKKYSPYKQYQWIVSSDKGTHIQSHQSYGIHDLSHMMLMQMLIYSKEAIEKEKITERTIQLAE